MGNWSSMVGNIADTKTLPGAVFVGVVFVLGALLAGQLVGLAVHRYLDRTERGGADPTGIRFLGQLARVAVYIFALVCYAHVVPALQKLGTAWLASVGIVSVLVGLAAQSTLGNLIAGISLVLYRPFKIGDRLMVNLPTGLEKGVVESIDLGYTSLRTADKRRLIIPNNNMASQACIDLSMYPSSTAFDISVYVASGGDVDLARKILLDLARGHQKIATVDGCFVTRITAKGAILKLAAASANPDDVAEVQSDLRLQAKKQFDAAGLKLA
jgi:small conductance mechanosensitive channel